MGTIVMLAAPKSASYRAAPHLARIVVGLVLAACARVPRQDVAAQVTPAVDDESTPLRAWYFAEGNSRSGFETYFTLVNLADQPAGVTVNYNRDDGIRL